jgi:NADH-quinone oxidoreductase subunit E
MIAAKTGAHPTLNESELAQAREWMNNFPEGKSKSAILNILHLAQEKNGGWLSVDMMDYVAEIMKLLPIEVYEVATFYSMFNGSDQIIAYINQKLGIKAGETTSDGMFTLKTVECLGACGYAPMMQLGKTFREHLTKEKVDHIIDECRNKLTSEN